MTTTFWQFCGHSLNYGTLTSALRGTGATEEAALTDALLRYRGHVGYRIGGAGYHATGVKSIISVKQAPGILGGKGGMEAIVTVEGTTEHVTIWTTRGQIFETSGNPEVS
jgi:hypothetical protein